MMINDELVNKLTKVVSLLSVCFYVTGFLITSSYLQSIGVSDRSFINTRYVLTGALGCVVATSFYFFVFRHLNEQFKNPIKHPSFIFTFLYRIGLSSILAYWIFIENPTDGLIVFLKLFEILFVATFIGLMVLKSSGWKDKTDRAFCIFYLLINLFGGFILFGKDIYPNIKQSIGGGKSIPISISLKNEADQSTKNMFAENSTNTFLIFESDKKVIFAFESSSQPIYYQLDSSLINSLAYNKVDSSHTSKIYPAVKDLISKLKLACFHKS